MKVLLAALALLFALPAAAAPLGDAQKTALAGEWRADACDARDTASFTLEFALTGGQIFLEAPGVGRLMLRVPATDGGADTVALTFQNQTVWSFARPDAATLVSTAPPEKLPMLKGLTFHRCRPPADRDTLKVARDAVAFFSVMMPPDHPTFIDAHEKDGCHTASYRYVSIDLVGPEEFALTRGRLEPAGTDTPAQLADVTTWSIDAAEELPNVVRLTITPLSGPGHTVRGAPEKISLVAGVEMGLLTIPEWDEVYRRCTIQALAH